MKARGSLVMGLAVLVLGAAAVVMTQGPGSSARGLFAQEKTPAADPLLNEILAADRAGGEAGVRAWMAQNKARVETAWIGQLSQRAIKEKDKKLIDLTVLLAEEKGDEKGLAAISLAAGDFYQRDDAKTALDLYAKAAGLFEKLQDKAGQGNAFFGMGQVHNLVTQNQLKAIECFNRTVALRRELGDRAGEAATLTGMGNAYTDIGEKKKSLECYEQSLAIRRSIGDRAGEARNLNNIGIIYYDLGEFPKALDYYGRALPIFQSVGDRSGEARAYNNLGIVYSDMGEKQKALEFYNLALPIHQARGNRASVAITLTNIGNVYSDLGEQRKALEYFSQVLAIFRELGDRVREGWTLNNMGVIYHLLGDEPKALEYYNQALPIERALNFRNVEAIILNNMGEVYAVQGKAREALDYYNQALPIERAVGDRATESKTLDNIGQAHHDQGQSQKALEFYNQALLIERALGSRANEARTSSNLMRTWSALSKPRLAALYGKHAVDLCQQLRANIQGLPSETQQAYLRTVERTYRELADILAGQGRLWEAQQVLGLLKDEEYFEYVRRDSAAAKDLRRRLDLSPAETTALERYETVAEKVAGIGQQIEALRAIRSRTAEQEAELTRLREDLIATGRAFEVVLRQIEDDLGGTRGARDVVEALRATKGLGLDLRNLGIVVLSTVVAEKTTWVILTTPTVQVAGKTEIPEAELNRLVLTFREALQDREADPLPLARRFYDILISPIEKELKAASPRTVAWMLDGTLRYLPVAALHDGKRYLIERFANVELTLASRSRLGLQPVGVWRALGLGVSEAHEGFEGLPSVADELRAVVHEEGSEGGALPGRKLLNRDFTRQALEGGREAGYQVVHIASHFIFKSNAAESFLLLGDGGHLTVEDMRIEGGLFTGVELLTLSACNTAMGGERTDGREVEGLGVEAQNQGAQAVLATLWPVVDQSTAELMAAFYRGRQEGGLSKAEALRQAQLTLLRDSPNKTAAYDHPCFWAPFILIGNWK